MLVALELQNTIDYVFQHFGTCQCALLGDVADEYDTWYDPSPVLPRGEGVL